MTRDNPSAAKPHAVLGRTQPWQEPAAGCCQTRWWRRWRRPLMGKDRRGKAAAGGRTLRHLGLHTQSQMWPRETGHHPDTQESTREGSRHTTGGRDGDRPGSVIPAGPGDPQQCPAPLSTRSHPAVQGPWRTHPGLTSAGDPSRQVNPIFFSYFFFFPCIAHTPRTSQTHGEMPGQLSKGSAPTDRSSGHV